MDAGLLLHPYQMPLLSLLLIDFNRCPFVMLAESDYDAYCHNYHITFRVPALINRYALNLWRATALK